MATALPENERVGMLKDNALQVDVERSDDTVSRIALDVHMKRIPLIEISP